MNQSSNKDSDKARAMTFGIAGAGLMGRLLAWQLLRQGQQVTLFDSDTIGGEASAARVAAAMLAPFSEALTCEPEIFHWGLAGLELWPELIRSLNHDSGKTTPYQHRGSVLLAHPQDHNNLLDFNRLLKTRVDTLHQSSIEQLDKQGLQTLEPELANIFSSGIFLRDEACIDNWCLLDNLAEAILSLGGSWQSETLVEKVKPGMLIVSKEREGTTDKKSHRFDWVIDTRGLGAKAQQPNLRGVRGEVLWVTAPEVKLSRPVRLLHPRYQLYIVPKSRQRYVIGATEIESESMAPMTCPAIFLLHHLKPPGKFHCLWL